MTDLTTLSGVLCLLGFLQWLLKLALCTSDKRYPDGPNPLGIFGNIFTLKRLLHSPDHELMKMSRTWGDTCMVWAARYPILVVNKAQVAKELLVDRGNTYASRPEPNSFRTSIWPWRLPSISAGPQFRYLRKLYQNLLSPQRATQLRTYQEFESRILLRDLQNHPESFFEDVDRYSLSVIFSAVYGIRLKTPDHPITVELFDTWLLMLQHLQPGSLLIHYVGILQRLPTRLQPGYGYAMKLRNREMRLHFAFFNALKAAIARGTAPDCFGKHLHEVQGQDGLDDSAAVDILAMIIAGGGHTTSSILQAFFKIMVLHPEVVEKAQHELDQVVGPNRLPTWEDKSRLPYMTSLIKELHRCCGVGGLGVPHATTKDEFYRGRLIPKGAGVVPNLTAFYHDEQLYPNPDVFEPERFREDHLDSASSAIQPDCINRDHFNYGFGRRLCPGIHMAEQSLYIVISRILWAFDIQKKAGCDLDMSAKKHD
ncbi:MAG: hypothetical protein LQ339_000685 [Xanthoria mediterranea]|nr:MAG: hypothetical protein LQ339_000685 [Xanthoria mediterranea]